MVGAKNKRAPIAPFKAGVAPPTKKRKKDKKIAPLTGVFVTCEDDEAVKGYSASTHTKTLKAALERRGQPSTGLKSEQLKRLQDYVAAAAKSENSMDVNALVIGRPSPKKPYEIRRKEDVKLEELIKKEEKKEDVKLEEQMKTEEKKEVFKLEKEEEVKVEDTPPTIPADQALPQEIATGELCNFALSRTRCQERAVPSLPLFPPPSTLFLLKLCCL